MRIRSWLFRLHWLLGLFVGGLLAFSGLTGSLLVFSREANEALYPDLLRVQTSGDRRSLEEILEAVRKAHPAEEPRYIVMPRREDGVYEFRLGSAQGRRVYVDPHTASILGSRGPTGTLASLLFYLHTELLSGPAGKTVLGTGAFCLLALCLTGLTLWWPGRSRLSRALKVNWRANWKRVNYDVHRVIGAVAALLLMTSALTGASLVFAPSFEATLNWLTGSPQRADPPASTPSRPLRAPLDELVRAADAALPGAETTTIILPGNSSEPLTVRKKLPVEMHPNGKSFVHFDQWNGRVLRVDRAPSSPLGTRIFNNLYPIHIGHYGGLPTRALLLLVGLTPSILFVTGFLMWQSRMRALRKAQALAPRAGAPVRLTPTRQLPE